MIHFFGSILCAISKFMEIHLYVVHTFHIWTQQCIFLSAALPRIITAMRRRTRDTFKQVLIMWPQNTTHSDTQHRQTCQADSVQTAPKLTAHRKRNKSFKSFVSDFFFLLCFLSFLLFLKLHRLTNIFKVFLNVVYDLHSRLWNPGSGAKHGTHAALVQELVILQGREG